MYTINSNPDKTFHHCTLNDNMVVMQARWLWKKIWFTFPHTQERWKFAKKNQQQPGESSTIQGTVHQIVSPISNSQFTKIFRRIFIMISFSTGKLRKIKLKNLFLTNKKFVLFFNCSNWEKFVEKIGEKKLVKTSDEFVTSPCQCPI